MDSISKTHFCLGSYLIHTLQDKLKPNVVEKQKKILFQMNSNRPRSTSMLNLKPLLVSLPHAHEIIQSISLLSVDECTGALLRNLDRSRGGRQSKKAVINIAHHDWWLRPKANEDRLFNLNKEAILVQHLQTNFKGHSIFTILPTDGLTQKGRKSGLHAPLLSQYYTKEGNLTSPSKGKFNTVLVLTYPNFYLLLICQIESISFNSASHFFALPQGSFPEKARRSIQTPRKPCAWLQSFLLRLYCC